MDDHERSYDTFMVMANRQAGLRRLLERRARRRKMVSVAALALLVGLVWAFWPAAAHGASKTCSLSVPVVRVQLDGTGTRVGHVTGSCSFAWHSHNRIRLDATYVAGSFIPARWHVLGEWNAPGGAAGEQVSQPTHRDPYSGCGYWQYVVNVKDTTGATVLTVRSATREFCA